MCLEYLKPLQNYSSGHTQMEHQLREELFSVIDGIPHITTNTDEDPNLCEHCALIEDFLCKRGLA